MIEALLDQKDHAENHLKEEKKYSLKEELHFLLILSLLSLVLLLHSAVYFIPSSVPQLIIDTYSFTFFSFFWGRKRCVGWGLRCKLVL
ncbi:hypothetical protein Lalb_Chr16g0378461 [Lupinus albus]|uniref:Transmembrane protein n=1 Tax=Lupinus albus TaxID=3870 RepID=A0A6A4P588_LUPAL|nr:hypothetical protein Lalb_Chr16g0378461 [Lupinus albus]